ncbi:uncharacterized protein LOC135077229 [Ostrinia nubilalis]|uniref:uncharacterized protein LOC135077229 n=1 Tax=Ostrinia nubilalis TaxID=29057 RepID=UPI0030825F4E
MSSSQYLPPELQEAIETIIKNEDFTAFNIDVKKVEKINSYVGVYREINIKGENKNGHKELQLFTKTIPDKTYIEASALSAICSITDAFKKENFMYSEFRKNIDEVQEEANIPVEERYTLVKSYASTDSDTIVMDNLEAKGFVIYPHQDVMPLKFAELAMQRLAKFHSLTFILKERRPKFFEEKVKTLHHPVFYKKKSCREFFDNLSQISLNFLSPCQKEKMVEFLPTTYDKYEKYLLDPADTWTLVHGDYRPSNIMVQLKDGDAFEVMPIDYQSVFYGCSIFDLIWIMITSTDQEFRKNHMEHLKNVYHESMKEFLKLFNIDVEQYYPRAEFERLYKEKLPLGLMFALWFLPGHLTNNDDILNKDFSASSFKKSDVFETRIRGIVDDYIQWGYV